LCGLTAAGLAFGTGAELLKIGMLALFVLATGPTAAHAIGRAAALSGSADSPWNAGSPADAGRGDADTDGTAGGVDP
jgi:multicomponent Na+:H+ antiporter subunit G